MGKRRTRGTPARNYGVREAVVREYRNLASRYDRRWERYIDVSVQRTVRQLRVAEGDSILDVGCGTGLLLDRIRKLHPSTTITGVDLTRDMLNVAARRLPSATRLHQATAEALPFPASTFDTVVSSSVLHYVPAPLTALEEAARVLRPRGQLLVTDWCRDFIAMKALDLYLRASTAAHVRTYSSRELVDLVERAGFRHEALFRYRAGALWGLMTVVGEAPARHGQ